MDKWSLCNAPDQLESLVLDYFISCNENNENVQKTIQTNRNYLVSIPIEKSLTHRFNLKLKGLKSGFHTTNLLWSKLLLLITSVAFIGTFWQGNPSHPTNNKVNSKMVIVNSSNNSIKESLNEILLDTTPEKKYQTDSSDKVNRPENIIENDSADGISTSNPVVYIPKQKKTNGAKPQFFDEEFLPILKKFPLSCLLHPACKQRKLEQ